MATPSPAIMLHELSAEGRRARSHILSDRAARDAPTWKLAASSPLQLPLFRGRAGYAAPRGWETRRVAQFTATPERDRCLTLMQQMAASVQVGGQSLLANWRTPTEAAEDFDCLVSLAGKFMRRHHPKPGTPPATIIAVPAREDAPVSPPREPAPPAVRAPADAAGDADAKFDDDTRPPVRSLASVRAQFGSFALEPQWVKRFAQIKPLSSGWQAKRDAKNVTGQALWDAEYHRWRTTFKTPNEHFLPASVAQQRVNLAGKRKFERPVFKRARGKERKRMQLRWALIKCHQMKKSWKPTDGELPECLRDRPRTNASAARKTRPEALIFPKRSRARAPRRKPRASGRRRPGESKMQYNKRTAPLLAKFLGQKQTEAQRLHAFEYHRRWGAGEYKLPKSGEIPAWTRECQYGCNA